jgi:hypothetical protein
MTDQVEIANGRRGYGDFPAHWGLPEGSSQSEDRVGWVLRNIAEDQALKRRGFDPVEVRSGKRPRTMSGHEALARIAAMASEKL